MVDIRSETPLQPTPQVGHIPHLPNMDVVIVRCIILLWYINASSLTELPFTVQQLLNWIEIQHFDRSLARGPEVTERQDFVHWHRSQGNPYIFRSFQSWEIRKEYISTNSQEEEVKWTMNTHQKSITIWMHKNSLIYHDKTMFSHGLLEWYCFDVAVSNLTGCETDPIVW